MLEYTLKHLAWLFSKRLVQPPCCCLRYRKRALHSYYRNQLLVQSISSLPAPWAPPMGSLRVQNVRMCSYADRMVSSV